MRLTTALLADAAEVNYQTGKLYVHGGHWSRINVSTFPATHPMMAVVLVVEVSYDEALAEHLVTVVLERDGVAVGPRVDGALVTGHAPGQTRGAPTTVPMALAFPQLTFDQPGRYEWRVLLDDKPVESIAMDIASMPTPPQPVP